MLGLGHSDFKREDFRDAEKWLRQVVEQFLQTEAVPEALCWAGVARYKGSGDPSAS